MELLVIRHARPVRDEAPEGGSADPGLADIGRRWGHGPRSLSTYRKRLLLAGLITTVGRGRVGFADSTVRGYVRARAASEGFTEPSANPGS